MLKRIKVISAFWMFVVFAALAVGSTGVAKAQGDVAAMVTVESSEENSHETQFLGSGQELEDDSLQTNLTQATSTWQALGNPAGFSDGKAGYTSLFVLKKHTTPNIPYISFLDYANGDKMTVKRYDANQDAWLTVGTEGFTPGKVNYSSLWVNDHPANLGTPYVVFSDSGKSGKATVMKYSGGSWQVVKQRGISKRFAYFPAICGKYSVWGNKAVVYVAFRDQGNSDKLSVLRYKDRPDQEWEYLGNQTISSGKIYGLSLTRGEGSLFVAYSDNGGGYDRKALVKKYDSDSNTWDLLGVGPVSPARADSLSLKYNGDNHYLYLAYQDTSDNFRVTVKRCKPSDPNPQWETVGQGGFTTVNAKYTSLCFIDHGGDDWPYVAFQDYPWPNHKKISVMRFNGTQWEYVGSRAFSEGYSSRISLDSYDNVPCVGYYASWNSYKAKAMIFE